MCLDPENYGNENPLKCNLCYNNLAYFYILLLANIHKTLWMLNFHTIQTSWSVRLFWKTSKLMWMPVLNSTWVTKTRWLALISIFCFRFKFSKKVKFIFQSQYECPICYCHHDQPLQKSLWQWFTTVVHRNISANIEWISINVYFNCGISTRSKLRLSVKYLSI